MASDKKNPPVAKYAGPAGHFIFALALKRNQRHKYNFMN